jgi:hypothetical protein
MSEAAITAESRYVRRLARRVADACLTSTAPAAILLTGSAAIGVADRYSDLDLICYCEALPPEEATARVREALGATGFVPIGARDQGQFAEQFAVAGIVCQVAYTPITAWGEEICAVLAGEDVASPAQKAMSGLLEGIPLHGETLIETWQARAAAYPDALARAMVAHYLRLFPLWYIEPTLPARDATVWVQQMLVEGAQHVLGILAGLNRKYYSPFQFKQMDTSPASARLGKRHPPWDLPDEI